MSKKISSLQMEKIHQWILANARDIDRALYKYQFVDGSANEVFAQLSHYQNIDDGFGKGLEPDFFTQHSTSVATTVAFQYFNKLKSHLTFENEMLRKGIGYFVSHYDKQINGWAFTLPHVNEAPHAPWWEYSPGRDSAAFDPNPTVEILGYLYEFKRFVPESFMKEVVHRLTEEAISMLTSDKEIEFHGLLCYQRFYALANHDLQERMNTSLINRIVGMVGTDPSQWSSYGATPLAFIQSDSSLGYEELKDAVEHNLDYLVETLCEDRYWNPAWEWPTDKDNWEIARGNWRSYLTVHYLKVLRNFDRLEMPEEI